MAQRSTPSMVPLDDFGKTPEIAPAPVNWRRRAMIFAGIAIASGGAIGGLAYLQRVAGTRLDPGELKNAGSGQRGEMTLP
ncbi:MAG: hypothetical protein CL878_08490 [Dehalococcoidia bacterium]|nr:hypothetical protein [Dehalococcoidia bacterium]